MISGTCLRCLHVTRQRPARIAPSRTQKDPNNNRLLPETQNERKHRASRTRRHPSLPYRRLWHCSQEGKVTGGARDQRHFVCSPFLSCFCLLHFCSLSSWSTRCPLLSILLACSVIVLKKPDGFVFNCMKWLTWCRWCVLLVPVAQPYPGVCSLFWTAHGLMVKLRDLPF